MKTITDHTYRQVLHELRASLSRYEYDLDFGDGDDLAAFRIMQLERLIEQVEQEAGR